MALHWARFQHVDGRIGFGVTAEGQLAEYEGDMFDGATATGRTLPLPTIRLLAPCVPKKIVALWNNFHAVCAKQGKQPPAAPRFLLKPTCCLNGPGDDIRRPSSYPGKIAFEGELGIVIGRRCKDIAVADVPQYVFGYTCVDDITAIDVLNEDVNFAQWCRSKSYDTFGCIGPVIATGFDPANARVVTTMDGVERQNYPVSDMIFSPAELVSRLSQDMTLEAGDVIACGTSVGIGSIKDGAQVSVTIEGIGTLDNRLR